MTPMRRAVLAAAMACALLLPVVAASAAGAASGSSDLTVMINWGQGARVTWTLTCDPPGGTHPNRVRACALLDGLADPFPTTPTGVACSMIYSGPEQAHVTGTWQGRPIDYRFARNDGCATARWREYLALLSEPGVVSVRGRVEAGPTCPVQRPGDSCTATVRATVTATSGSRTRRASSGPAGFLLRLPRGVWSLTADAGRHCTPARVDTRAVPPVVVISCDTGIREAG